MGVKQVLRNPPLHSVQKYYLVELEEPEERLSNAEQAEIVDHITKNCAKVGQRMVENNREKFDQGIDVTKLLDVYTGKKEMCQEFSQNAG